MHVNLTGSIIYTRYVADLVLSDLTSPTSSELPFSEN